MTEVRVIPPPPVQVEVVQKVVRVTAIARPVTVIVSKVGVRGPPGPGGDGGLVTFPAGETIHGRRAVRAAAGTIYHPTLADISHATQVVGIATQAGSAGADVIVRTSGPISDAGWNWQPGAVFCGADGVLTQTPPATGWVLPVGRATSPTTLHVDVDFPLIRST